MVCETGRPVAILTTKVSTGLRHKFYYRPMYNALCDALLEAKIQSEVVPCVMSGQRQAFLGALPDGWSGLVFVGQLYAHDIFIRRLTCNANVPVVMLDHRLPHLPVYSVQDDASAGMKTLVEHLLCLGHRVIAYLDNENPDDNPWKREGVSTALERSGCPPLPPERIVTCRDEFREVQRALDWLMALRPRPTAVVCSGDRRALKLLRAATCRGLSVPGNLSVAGYGDTAVTSGRHRRLTSVRIDVAELGKTAARCVLGPRVRQPVLFLIPPDLVVRRTTAPPDAGKSPRPQRPA